jgi:N-acetylglucosaminyldiphosphoundecaprenol N-acetyl-beta-D-mannosaminyltransferase
MTCEGFVVEGVQVNCFSRKATAERIAADTKLGQSFGVFTLNLDHVVKLRRSSEFRTAYRKARYVTADGFPIVWAGRILGAQAERVTGADLIVPLCHEAAKSGLPVYLFGSTFAALTGSARALAGMCPGLDVAGVTSPAVGFDPTSQSAVEFARRVAESGAKICFVALGAPKQELFVETAVAHAPGVAFVCIGAGLDFIAGVQARAPQWAQASGTEWLWRLLSNPKRLGRRYLECLIVLPSILLASLASQRSVADASST